jgi:hypothetical protein
MHLYKIEKGTTGKLIDRSGTPVIRDWVVRRNLSFYNFIVDPISYHNNRGNLNLPVDITRLAERGYAVYGGENGGDDHATYLLAVPYSSVKVF